MKKYLFLNLCLFLCLSGCQKDDRQVEEGNERKSILLTRAEKEISSQHADFAFNFFKAANAQEEGKKDKMVVSPLSASFAMTMLANGAENETLNEMTEALRISGFNLEEVNAYNKKLVEQLATLDKKATLLTANSFWMNSWFEALPQFKNTLEANYDAEMKQVDFATALPAINQWCADKTNGHVKEILTELDERSNFVLLNALYFKGEWAAKFRKEDTSSGEFTDSEGVRIPSVSYMNRKEWKTRYFKNDLFALATLPFGNGAFRMQILLPNEGVGLEQCINTLDGTLWEQCRLEASIAKLVLKIPKYKVYTHMEQQDALKAMGVKRVFETNAELGKLTSKRTLDEKLTTWQACSFEVDEEGAVAAAVTSWNGRTMESYSPVVEFFVTRPFLFMVTEQSTGAFLFIGKVNKP